MDIQEILHHPQLRVKKNNQQLDSVLTFLEEKIDNSVLINDEQNANYFSKLRTIYDIQNNFIAVFDLFENGEYYAGWCLLERIEISIKWLLQFFSFTSDEYKIIFIKEHVYKLQKLFPYKVFGSSEYIKKEIRCSICDSILSLRKRCQHKKGQLYMGKLCTHNITQAEFIGIAVVSDPFNKYSVMGVTKKEDDPYHYPQIEYLLSIIDHPFDEWHTEVYKKIEPHTSYKEGRNDNCPCGSKIKYKKCCLKKPGIEIDHTEFILKYPTAKTRMSGQIENRKLYRY